MPLPTKVLAPRNGVQGHYSLNETGPSYLQGQALGCVLPKLRGTRPGGPQPLPPDLLLPRYMAEAVSLQRMVGSDWVPTQNLHFPTYPSVLSPPAIPGPGPGPQPQPLSLYKPGKGPPGNGEASALQEVRSMRVCACACVCWERGSVDFTGIGGNPLTACWAGPEAGTLRT